VLSGALSQFPFQLVLYPDLPLCSGHTTISLNYRNHKICCACLSSSKDLA
jgi:hypothetical protein